ncbi:MAG: TSUP family transporter [Rhizobiales bacterium]|nr:TSUP family transporter [Hyphomicrobiales bacterium]NRB14754.1 TSUP family transporter [Hyphomicrobiales bacterium]
MFEINLSYDLILILFMASCFAGFIDALAGGGGLITVPLLLLTGMSPLAAIATNKFQAVFGTPTSSITVYRKKIVTKQDVFQLVFASLAGSCIGAIVLLFVDAKKLEIIIPIILLSIAFYFLFAPKIKDDGQRQPKISRPLYRFVIVPIIGFYDGILGPGTGSFFAAAGVALRGQNLVKSTSIAKFLNLASNLAALIIFIFSGHVVWLIGAIMIFGQILGGYLGSMAIINGGTKFIRPLIIVMSFGMTGKYIYTVWL